MKRMSLHRYVMLFIAVILGNAMVMEMFKAFENINITLASGISRVFNPDAQSLFSTVVLSTSKHDLSMPLRVMNNVLSDQ